MQFPLKLMKLESRSGTSLLKPLTVSVVQEFLYPAHEFPGPDAGGVSQMPSPSVLQFLLLQLPKTKVKFRPRYFPMSMASTGPDWDVTIPSR